MQSRDFIQFGAVRFVFASAYEIQMKYRKNSKKIRIFLHNFYPDLLINEIHDWPNLIICFQIIRLNVE